MVSLLSIDTASNFGSICCSPGLDPNEVMYRGGSPMELEAPKWRVAMLLLLPLPLLVAVIWFHA